MTTQVFHNGHILTERGFETGVCVVVEDGHIVAVLHGPPPASGEHIDLQGGTLVPRIIDVQDNGGSAPGIVYTVPITPMQLGLQITQRF